MNNPGFWKALENLIAESDLVIDRPKGSRHPRYPELIYCVDYGYLAGTRSMDGGGIDVWRGTRADQVLDAVIVTVDAVKKDSEIKLLIGVTAEELSWISAFHNNSDNMKGLLIGRE